MPSYRYIVLGFFLLVYGCWAEAQPSSPQYLGTKTPYQPLQIKHTPPPAHFKPVFINYVGRHGARFMTKPGSDILILDVLQQAENMQALTQTGRQLQKAAIHFESIEKGDYENITLLGAEEQKGIAKRLFDEYKNVFKQKGIEIFATTKVRTQQSANAFLAGIPVYEEKDIHREIIVDTADAMLRFYDMSPAYKKYEKSKEVQQHLDSLNQDKKMSEAAADVCSKIFTNVFSQQLSAGTVVADDGAGKKIKVSAVSFTKALYDVYAIAFSLREEIAKKYGDKQQNYFAAALTKKDLQWLDLIGNAEEFYAKGAAEDTLGIQVTIAAPLLVNFINTTDSVVNGLKKSAAIFRFTHAEAISPFATLLGIPQASAESNSVYAVQQYWQASEIIPLSANIQWIFYTDGKQYLLKVLLNEKEVSLPVSTATFPYYNWQTVRQYYLQKLNKLGVGLQSDMQEYLQRK